MLTRTIKLVSPEAGDLSAIVELDRTCFGGIWTLEGYRRELESPNSDLLILKIDDRIVGLGCFWAILDEAHITLLAVHPDYQGRGFGKLLLIKLLESALDRDLERVTLEVRVSNEKAINLYEKFGFKKAGIRKNYYPATGEDALILWRGDLQRKDFLQELTRWSREIKESLNKNNWELIEGTGSNIELIEVQNR